MTFLKNLKGYPEVPLIEIATLKRGYDLPVQNRAIGDIPIYAANGQNGTHNEAKVSGPGVVTGRSGTIGKVHYVEGDYWPLNTSLYVTDFHGNHPKWVYYMLQAFKLDRFIEGAGVPTLNRNLVHGEKIPLPPLAEQKRISAILDKADSLRRERQQAIQLANQFIYAVFLNMFGDPMTNPRGWEVGTFLDICQLNPKAHKYDDNLLVSFIPMQRISEDSASIDLQEKRPYAEVKKGFTAFIEGDVLFAKITPCMENGKAGIAQGLQNGAGFGSTEFHIFRPSQSEYAEFIYSLVHLESFRKLAASNFSGAVGHKRVPKDFLENFALYLPPFDLIKQYSAIFNRVKLLLRKLDSTDQKVSDLFNSLSQKAFSGQL